MAQQLTLAHALTVALTFGFTGWLIERGEPPHSALLITFAALAGTVVVTRLSRRGAMTMLRRLTSCS